METKRSSLLSIFIERLPQWFAVIAALVYATGFLIEFTFFDFLGVRGAANDIFKARYIHVGFLFLQFPASILALILAYIKLRAIVKKATKKAKFNHKSKQPSDASLTLSNKKLGEIKLYTTSILLLGTLLGGFYLMVTFARPGVFSNNQIWISAFFFIIIIGLIAIRELEHHVVFKTPKAKHTFGHIARIVCLWISWWVGYVIFKDTIPIVWDMLREGGYLCYGFWGLIGFIIYRLIKRSSEIEDTSYRFSLFIIGLAVLGALYYLTVLSFAARVYPFIPVIKGGGDYTTEKKAVLSFSTQYSNSIPVEIIDSSQKGVMSVPLIIIEETASSFIVSANDPKNWRTPGQTNKPDIVTIKKDAVTSLVFKK